MGQRWAILAAMLVIVVSGHRLTAAEPAGNPRDFGLYLNKSHPRLILTNDRLAELRTLATKDKLLAKCIADVVQRADDVCKKPMLQHVLVGPRLLEVSRESVDRQYTLCLAWRLTGQSVYADKAIENLLAVCAFKDWNPSHFLDTAEMSHAVAIGYDWLYSYMSAPVRERIKAGLIRNGLEPAMAKYGDKSAWWATSEFNWNQVANGGVLIGALAVADTDPKYAEVIIPQAVAALPLAIASYNPDGAWPEGPGYWNYATRYTAYDLNALQTALGRDFGLSNSQGLQQAGLAPLYLSGPTNLLLNYADAGENTRRQKLPCLFWLAQRYDMPLLAAAERQVLQRSKADPQDVMWYVPPADAPLPPLPLDKLLRGKVPVAVFRSAWDDANALFVGVKAGYNKVGHAHLDLGTFELDALGQRWARDLGSDNYDIPKYWDGKTQDGQRWAFFRLGSMSHNVPMLNDNNQRLEGVAGVVQFKSSQDSGLAVLDLSSAYKGPAQKFMRGVAMLPGRRSVLIQDEMQLAQPTDVAWGMTTDAAITVEGSQATLKLRGKELRVTILSPAGASFSVASAEQQPPQNVNRNVERLMIRLKNLSGGVRIAVQFSPVWPDKQPPAAATLKPLAEW